MARSKSAKPSQADVAAALGLSISTVSRALSGADGISDAVRRRVNEAATEMGYRTRSAPRASFDRLIVLVAIFDANSPLSWVYQQMLDGITAEAMESGVPVETHMISETDRIPAGLQEQISPSTGVVFLGPVPNVATIDWLTEQGVAAVIVNGVDPSQRIDSVSPANYFGGRLVAEHLAKLGHRRVIYLGGSLRWTLARRFHGFRDGLEDFCGDAAEIVDIRYMHSESSHERLRELNGWLRERLGTFTAVFCFNDLLAAYVLEVMREFGQDVPGDVSVIGFDDMPLARMSTPGLSTFRIDWRSIGADSVRFLYRRRLSIEDPARELQVAGQLVPRATTAAPR